jgi:hypothetical protein
MIGSSHPLHTHTRSTSYIYKVLDILYMRWAVIYHHYHIFTSALAKFGAWHYGDSKMVCCKFGPQTTVTHISQLYYIYRCKLFWLLYILIYLLWYRCNHIQYMWDVRTTHPLHPSWLIWYCNVIAVHKDKTKMRWMRHRIIILVNAIIYFNCIILLLLLLWYTTTTIPGFTSHSHSRQ